MSTMREPDEWDAARVSAMLFRAREHLEMWAGVVAIRNREDESLRALIAEVDAYRAARGWSPHGFGGES